MAATEEHRKPAAWLLVAYVAFLGWTLFNPSANAASSVVRHVTAALHDLGLSTELVTSSRVEFGLNALMFVPATFLASLIWPRVAWQSWTAYAFIASGCVELFQGLCLPDRTAQYVDVVSNTLGGFVGAVLGTAWVRLVGSRAGQSSGPTDRSGNPRE